MNSPSLRPRDEVVRYWLGVARWSLLILLVFELVVRIFVMRLPPYEYKSEWGLVPVEDSSSVQGREGYGVLHYLADGEIRTPYDGEGISVVILGDSTVQAAQVNDSENFVSLTEAALRQEGFDVNLHNLGGSERTMADYVFMAPAVRQHFSPRVVVAQVSPASFSLAFNTAKENHFVTNKDGSLGLVHDNSLERNLAARNIFFASGLVSLFNFRWQITSDELADQLERIRFRSSREMAASGRKTFRTLVKNPVNDSHMKVLRLARELKTAYPGSEIVFLVIPYTPRIDPNHTRKISWTSNENRRLVELLSSVPDVHVVYIQESFEKFYKQYFVLPRGSFNSQFNFGHLNRYGHRAVAQTLTEAMEAILK